MRTLLAAVALGLLAACATATPYQPAADGYGFNEQQIESNRVRISFRGNNLTDRDTVETYMLFRAAELTLQNGKDYFVIANRQTDERSRLQAVGGRPYMFDYYYFSPRYGWAPWHDPFWGDYPDYREVTRYEAVAEIQMFDGQKPADNPDAFDAREVQANLQGRIVRPSVTG